MAGKTKGANSLGAQREDPGSDPGSDPSSDPGSDPGFILSLSHSLQVKESNWKCASIFKEKVRFDPEM